MNRTKKSKSILEWKKHKMVNLAILSAALAAILLYIAFFNLIGLNKSRVENKANFWYWFFLIPMAYWISCIASFKKWSIKYLKIFCFGFIAINFTIITANYTLIAISLFNSYNTKLFNVISIIFFTITLSITRNQFWTEFVRDLEN